LQNLPAPLTASPRLSADDICWRVIAATVAEGARLLMQGSVPRAGTLDALAVTALGMPRSLGGPLCMADQRGLLVVRRDLTRWQQDHAVWTPPALLHELVAQGRPLRGVDMDNPA
jgi:3-hydroxyacyl-CoA dehydrogenase